MVPVGASSAARAGADDDATETDAECDSADPMDVLDNWTALSPESSVRSMQMLSLKEDELGLNEDNVEVKKFEEDEDDEEIQSRSARWISSSLDLSMRSTISRDEDEMEADELVENVDVGVEIRSSA